MIKMKVPFVGLYIFRPKKVIVAQTQKKKKKTHYVHNFSNP